MKQATGASERVVENLNRALHELFEAEPATLLLGEDLLDPYGGAFKVARGLSTRYPQRVLPTPISENAILGIAAGLALEGEKPIAEIMFGDFAALAFDQILNFASKSVTMYGEHVPLDLLVRCPVGGGRGYGPTHSQCLQKHFLGIPNLDLYELSPLHDNVSLLPRLVNLGRPVILFEDKSLYSRRMLTAGEGWGEIHEIFQCEPLGGSSDLVRVFVPGLGRPDAVLIAGGGVFHRCLTAAQEALVEHEINVEILVPSRIYPLDLAPALPTLAAARRLLTVEEGTAGGTWGADVAHSLYRQLWGRLAAPVEVLSSKDSIIPSSQHLERQVLVQAEDICRAVVAASAAEVARA